MNEATPRLGFPLMASGQAQKEITHNEAIMMADILVQPTVQAVAPPAIPVSPSPGQCWIVGEGATAAWAGQDNAIACWTDGGWRFVPSYPGMRAWSLADGLEALRTNNRWVVGLVDAASVKVGGVQVVGPRQPAISNVSGGTVVDTEVRATLGAILAALRKHGLIET